VFLFCLPALSWVSASRAWVKVGDLLKDQGDTEGARAAYQHAIDSEHEDWAPAAWHDLGDLLRD
jgi:hypothetical protein